MDCFSSLLLLLLLQPLACQIKFNSKLVSALFYNNAIPLSLFKPPALLIAAKNQKPRTELPTFPNYEESPKFGTNGNETGRGKHKWENFENKLKHRKMLSSVTLNCLITKIVMNSPGRIVRSVSNVTSL